MRLNIRPILILCAVLLVPPVVYAGNCTCNGTTLNAGAYSVFQATATQPTVTLGVTCNGNATYNIAFSAGNSGNTGARWMQQGAGDKLTYNIFTDPTRLIVWAGTNQKVYSSSGSTTFNESLYLKIDPLQDVSISGAVYSDTIMVTMTPDVGTGGPTRSCSFTVQESVTPECLAPGAALPFGNYDVVVANKTAANPLDASTTLSYQCTKGVSATIGLDYGSNPSGTIRRLAGPAANFLTYDIFTDNLRSVRWTSLVGGMVTASSTSKDLFLGGGIVAYGRIPGAQDTVAGAYSDSVTATINY